MATLDDDRGVLVIRIVYDGPALSGKTTSLRALARGVSRNLETPEEKAGRTLFFDWMEYVGGLFEGRQIRCQIISVPGQRELAHRRKVLLETADAVVLVLDTRLTEWEFGFGWLKETIPYCRAKDPPLGLVLQANKRDAADAVPREDLRTALKDLPPVAVVESTATAGDGIREAFVLAVRLALDRVRVLAHTGNLRIGRPEEEDASALYRKLQVNETLRSSEGMPSFADSVDHALQAELTRWVPELSAATEASHEASDERPFVPDPLMPGGMIWPPVDGRALLHEVASLDIKPRRTRSADWWGAGSGFRFHSLSGAIFGDHHRARKELIEWARLHAANAPYLSNGRAVILADAGGNRLRLWQLVRADATLRERLASALALPDPKAVAKDVLNVASQLTAARESFRAATLHLPCTLWTVGVVGSYKPTFVGLMPCRDSELPTEPEGSELLERELAPHLRELRWNRVDYREFVQRVLSISEFSTLNSPARWLSEVVAAT